MSVGSLERQLLDSEAVCDGLRRQLDAGDDDSARETELSRQVLNVYMRILGIQVVVASIPFFMFSTPAL